MSHSSSCVRSVHVASGSEITYCFKNWSPAIHHGHHRHAELAKELQFSNTICNNVVGSGKNKKKGTGAIVSPVSHLLLMIGESHQEGSIDPSTVNLYSLLASAKLYPLKACFREKIPAV